MARSSGLNMRQSITHPRRGEKRPFRYNPTMSKTVRTFIALPLPADVKTALGELNEKLATTVSPRAVRWVRPERMHLTLRFLGETAVADLPAIQAALEPIKAPPFTLTLDGLGGFPNRKRPRVIWVGLRETSGELAKLKRKLDATLAPLGWEKEKRRFNPHLTLGRVKKIGGVGKLAWNTAVPAADWGVTAVQFIQSDLQPDGPVYTVLHEQQLQ
jgi:2'-5' RNA ligase